MSNKKVGGIALFAFATAAGVVVAVRLDSTVWAAIAGAICALAVGVPVTAMATFLTVSARTKREAVGRHQLPSRESQYPPVIVVSPTGTPQLPQPGWRQSETLTSHSPRRFSVIGEDDE